MAVCFLGRMLSILVLTTALAVTGFHSGNAWAGDGVSRALDRGVAYLVRADAGGPSAWTVIALRAAGSRSLMPESASVSESDDSTTNCALALIAALAGGADRTDPFVRKLVSELQTSQCSGGKFADTVNSGGEDLINAHLWAIIALRAAEAAVPDGEAAYRWLAAQQLPDGGFAYAVGLDEPDVDMTAMALQAFSALGTGRDDPAVEKALDYLRMNQSRNGGFGAWGLDVTADSCAAVIMGLMAYEVDPAAAEWTRDGGNPVTALLTLQLPDGSFEYAAGLGPNTMSTEQAVLALADLTAGSPFRTRLGPAVSESRIKGVTVSPWAIVTAGMVKNRLNPTGFARLALSAKASGLIEKGSG